MIDNLSALGIGLHNLGEGLAVGASFVIGEAACGSFLIIGFTLPGFVRITNVFAKRIENDIYWRTILKRHAKTIEISILVILALGIAGLVYAQDPREPGKTNVTYTGEDGVTLQGYLVKPEGSGAFPAVLMIHEWWGLNHDITLLADALAREGFVVLAVDAFRGRVAQNPSEAMQQLRETPREQIAADLDAALDFLRSHHQVDPDRVASLGFCFGGTQSMYMGTRNPELAAVVIFYGSGPIQDANQLGSMKQAGPVLGIYGKEDSNIPVEQVRNFENAMDAGEVENTITIYPGVGHAFVKSDTYQSGGSPELAWKQMVNFLADTLKG